MAKVWEAPTHILHTVHRTSSKQRFFTGYELSFPNEPTPRYIEYNFRVSFPLLSNVSYSKLRYPANVSFCIKMYMYNQNPICADVSIIIFTVIPNKREAISETADPLKAVAD